MTGDWVMEEIRKWDTYLVGDVDHVIIPWEYQVGKLLKYQNGDVQNAITQARFQIGEEQKHPYGTQHADDQALQYWQNVIDYLTKRLVNDLILGA